MRQLNHLGWRLALVVVALLMFQPSVVSAEDSSPVVTSDVRSQAEEAIAFRRSVGFDTDLTFVISAESNPLLSRKYGVALTAEESAELDRRSLITSQLDPLETALAAQPTFAGLYFDHLAGGVIDIATTGEDAEITAIVDGLAPTGARVRVRKVAHALRSFQALQHQVERDLVAWAEHGIAIVTVAVDIPGNRLSIQVENLRPEDVTALQAKYGDSVHVSAGERATPAACVSRTNCGVPKKGGIQIVSSNGTSCTATMLGWTSSWNLVAMTAGHCLRNGGGLGITWSHNGVIWGQSRGYVYPGNGGTADADIGIISTTESNARNLVYGQNAEAIESVTLELSNASQSVGSVVCRSGATSGWGCGTITATNLTKTYTDGATIRNLWEVDRTSAGGDSGAPWLRINAQGVYIAGVHSAATSTRSYYGTISVVKSVYGDGLRPCLAPGC